MTLNKNNNLIAVDGTRGTGKTRVAAELRGQFGCGVVEIGPLFRLVSYLLDEVNAKNPVSACLLLMEYIKRGRITVDPFRGGSLSAMQIDLGHSGSMEELWAPEFDERIATIAGNLEVIQNIEIIARHLLNNNRGVVVGRQAGSELFPEAGLKIVLTASDRIRMRRKISQMVIELDVLKNINEVESSEPASKWNHDSRSIYIDTSHMDPVDVFEQVKTHIVEELGWETLAETGIAYGARI